MPGLFSGWRRSYLSYVFFFCLRPETGEVNGYVVEMGLDTVLVTYIIITQHVLRILRYGTCMLSTKTRRPFINRVSELPKRSCHRSIIRERSFCGY